MKAAQFDRLGVFSYSDEDTSASFHLDAKVDGRTIYNRKRKLMAVQRRISKARNRADDRPRGGRANRRAVAREPTCCGRRACPRRRPKSTASATSTILPGAAPRRGEIRRMRITEAHDYDLIGALDVPPEAPRRLLQPKRFPDSCRDAMKCPICKKDVSPEDQFFPFCSERCKIIDLGNWASEKYVISTPDPA